MLKEIETDNINEETCFYEIRFNPELIIHSDIKINFQGIVNFYVWVNLWYSTFEIISEYVVDNNYFEDEEDLKKYNININTGKYDDNSNSEINVSDKDIKANLSTDIDNIERKPKRRKTMSISFYSMKARHKKTGKRKSAVQAMKNNRDLNNIIDGIDELANEKKIPLIDRKNLVFIVKRNELDKLKTKCNDDFEVKYKFQLL
jgi:hypothetical protein